MASDMEQESMISDIQTTLSKEVYSHQIDVSSNSKDRLSVILYTISQNSYSYVINIKNYVKDNIRDAKSLKEQMIEKIHGNMGD